MATLDPPTQSPKPPPPGGVQRRHRRYDVGVWVRFQDAASFVREYAHNISEGGLFVATQAGLEIDDEISIAVELPGRGSPEVNCRVARVVSPDEAASSGATAGVGLEIIDSDRSFKAALGGFLRLLSQRHDFTVFIDTESEIGKHLERVGYITRELPNTKEVADVISDVKGEVALLVAEEDAWEYREALRGALLPDLTLSILDTEPPVEVLRRLDERVIASLTAPSDDKR